MDLLNRILKEANVENDLRKKKYAEQFLQHIEGLVDSYHGNTSEITYDPKNQLIQTQYKGIIFIFIDYRSPWAKKYAGTHGAYDPHPDRRTLFINNCLINYEDNKLSVKYDESTAYHELVHVMDFNRTKDVKGVQEKQSQTQGVFDDKAANDPYEFNAHFLQKAIPRIEKFIKNKDTIPNNYQEFVNELVQADYRLDDFYQALGSKFKRKFNKRLVAIFNSIKNVNYNMIKADDFNSVFTHSNKQKGNSEVEVENKIKEKPSSWWKQLVAKLTKI